MNRDESETAKIGNTMQSSQRYYWFFTLNNPGGDLETLCTHFEFLGAEYVIGEEVGASGTPHLQGWIKLKKRQRLSEMIKINKRIHWEPTRNFEAAMKYCQKDGKVHTNIKTKAPIKTYRPDGWWADEIESLVLEEPHPRTVHWYWEPEGGIGKSALAKYLYVTHGVTVITSSKSADIVTAIDEDTKFVLFDFPRCSNVGVYCPYNAIEQIKNGFITDAKLKKHARIVCFNSPHVVVLANDPPDMSKLSSDRWDVKLILAAARG